MKTESIEFNLTEAQVKIIQESLVERYCSALEYEEYKDAEKLDRALAAFQNQIPLGWPRWYKDPAQKSGGYYK